MALCPPASDLPPLSVPPLIPGSPYSVLVLQEGYSEELPDGSTRADGTVTLVLGPHLTLVDTGGPWGQERLLAGLAAQGISPGDVRHVVCTHGHSDHAGNLNLFCQAELIVGTDVCLPDGRYLPTGLRQGHPYPLQVLIPAIHIQATGSRGCCGNRCGMCLSVLLAAVGAAGAAYAIIVSMLGLVHGPLCQYFQNETYLDWGRPFEHSEERLSEDSYLFNTELWDICLDPPGVIRFNVILFSLILGAGLAELGLCLVQIFNGLFGCICGTCREEETPKTYN